MSNKKPAEAGWVWGVPGYGLGGGLPPFHLQSWKALQHSDTNR
jgi:hypothetical protein